MISRDERQAITCKKILDSKINGIIDVATGVGKTKMSGDILIWLNGKWKERNHFAKCNVIVPTNTIKKQWERFATYLNLSNIEVHIYIINGLVKNNIDLSDNDVTIYDELHLYPLGKEFGKIFELTNSKYRLGLSGTMNKKHKDALLKLKNPLKVVDTITIEEAEDNDWCAKTYTYNFYINLNEEERKMYDKINESFSRNAAYFNNDFDLFKKCGNIYYCKEYYHQIKEEYEGDFKNSDGTPMTEKEAISFLNQKAFWAMKSMQQRKKFIYDANSKINKSSELIAAFVNKFGNKVITFSESIESANQLFEQLSLVKNIKPVAFHSKMKSISVTQDILHKYDLIDLEGKTMNLFKPVKVTGSKLADLYIAMFDKSEYNACCSAEALKLGFDSKGILLSVEISGNSDKEGYNQKKGRGCRKEKIIYKDQEIDKIACYVNIILKDTQEESWTKKKQIGGRRIKSVTSVQEILDHFETVLDSQLC